MKNIKTFEEFVNESEKTNEGILDVFKKRNKKNKYNPNNMGYDHPNFDKEFPGFSKDPEKDLSDLFKEMDVTEKKMIPLLSDLIYGCKDARELMTQQDMVKGDNGNKFYIDQFDKFIQQLEEVELKVKKGIW